MERKNNRGDKYVLNFPRSHYNLKIKRASFVRFSLKNYYKKSFYFEPIFNYFGTLCAYRLAKPLNNSRRPHNYLDLVFITLSEALQLPVY